VPRTLHARESNRCFRSSLLPGVPKRRTTPSS